VPRNRWFTASSPARPARAAFALVVSGTLVLTACGGGSGGGSTAGSGSGSGGTGDGVLTLGLENTLPGWDWRKQITAGHVSLEWRPVYDTLLRLQVDGEVVPNAAEEFSYNEDKTVLTLKLREGMTFSDGAPVDAAAAKFSMDNFRDGGGVDSSRLRGVSIDVVDDLTFTMTLPGPNPGIVAQLGGSAGQLVSPATLDNPATLDTQPIGSGPYTLNTAETVVGSKFVFDRNPDYWNPEDFPYDKVEFLVMPDETAQLNALASGQIDGAELSLASVQQAESSGSHVESFPNVWSGLYIIDRAGTKIPALGDVRVRQAINMVFDREAIVKAIWNGQGSANASIFGPTTEGYDEELATYYDYDVEAAKKLMADAGYADGFDVTIPEVENYNQEYTAIVVQQLGELNIRATPVAVPRQESIPRIVGGEFPIFAYKLPVNPEVDQVTNYVRPNGSFNPLKSQDPALDELLAKWYVAEPEEAGPIYKDINKFLVENAWFAPFGNPDVTWAFNDSVTISGTIGTLPPLYVFQPFE
jgi:peptide/nickel transport system substrate-binding protein